MAARRLVIVMLVLLAVSTLAAALVPAPESDPGPADTTRARPTPGNGQPPTITTAGGRLVRARIEISNRRPETIAVRPGDQLQLQVSGDFGDDITIPAFGLTETMTRLAPARFDLIVGEAGTFPIRTVEAGRLVGRIRAAPAPKSQPRRGSTRDPNRG
jgi:hypothetical protein